MCDIVTHGGLLCNTVLIQLSNLRDFISQKHQYKLRLDNQFYLTDTSDELEHWSSRHCLKKPLDFITAFKSFLDSTDTHKFSSL